jgi:hypothetical protein
MHIFPAFPVLFTPFWLQARAALTAAQGEEAAAQGRLSEKEARQQELYRKQGGAKQYTSQAERDKALSKEVRAYDNI